MSSIMRSWIRLSVTIAERRWLRLSVTVSIRSHVKQWFNELQSKHYHHCSIVKLSLKCPDWSLTMTRPLSARATAGKALSLDLSRSSARAPTFEARTPATKRSRSSQEHIITHSTWQRRETMWRQTCWQEEKSSPYDENYLHIRLTKWWRLKGGEILTVAWIRRKLKWYWVQWRGLVRAEADEDSREGREEYYYMIVG